MGHLGGFENAETAARACADEDDAASLAERRRHHFDADRDALALTFDRLEHLAILVDHQIDEVVGVEFVDAKAEGVDGLGGERLPLGTNRHTTTILVERLIEG